MTSPGLIDTAKLVLGGGGATVAIPGLPLEFGVERMRTSLNRQPPAIGEHSADVLSEAGFAPEEIATLMTQAVVVNRARPQAAAAG